jgi:hypothetical protein
MTTKYKTVQELLSQPSRWTTRQYARNSHGDHVKPYDPHATCWCLVGAIDKVYPDQSNANVAIEKVRTVLTTKYRHEFPNVIEFNDNHNYSEVLEVVTLANI